MNSGSVQRPILRCRDLSAPVAVDAAGAAVAAGSFLADIGALAERLPAAGHIVNLCADRYCFAVGFFAALLRRQISLLPSSQAAAPMAELLDAYPDTYFLTDGAIAGPGSARTFRFPEDLDGGAVQIVPAVPADQTAAILFTSGSTGSPMPHPRRWGAMVNSAQAAGRALGLESVPAAYILGTVPHQHSYGLESIIMLALQHGLGFHRGRALLPGDILRQLETMPAPRILVTTPIHLRSLVTLDGKLPALDRILCATAPLAGALAQEAEARFAAPLQEIYGCTEIGQMAMRRTTETAEWTCIEGIALHERDGDIWASGDSAGATAPVGDIIDLIDAKRFVLKNRKADMVNIAGKRNSLGYLNHHLMAIEGVRDGVFVIPEGESRLTAYVVAPGLTAKHILDALRPRLDPAFLPRPIHFVDRLPRNDVGKLTRQALDWLEHPASILTQDDRRSEATTPRVRGRLPRCSDANFLHHDLDAWSSQDYRFAVDHPTGSGHFPGNPIIPGALLLDRMLDAMGRSRVDRQEIRVAKFLRPVRPGDSVIFRWRETGRDVAFECVLTDSGEVALSGSAALETA